MVVRWLDVSVLPYSIRIVDKEDFCELYHKTDKYRVIYKGTYEQCVNEANKLYKKCNKM